MDTREYARSGASWAPAGNASGTWSVDTSVWTVTSALEWFQAGRQTTLYGVIQRNSGNLAADGFLTLLGIPAPARLHRYLLRGYSSATLRIDLAASRRLDWTWGTEDGTSDRIVFDGLTYLAS